MRLELSDDDDDKLQTLNHNKSESNAEFNPKNNSKKSISLQESESNRNNSADKNIGLSLNLKDCSSENSSLKSAAHNEIVFKAPPTRQEYLDRYKETLNSDPFGESNDA